MRSSLLASCPLLLSSLGLAQSHVTSPNGFVHIEGDSHSSLLGGYHEGRYMFCDGAHRGTAMTLKATTYRPSNFVYTASNGTGRSWTSVKIHASEGDFDTFDRTFSTNSTTTPTAVFSAAVSWPTRSGKPSALPGNWDLAFPFATNWSYTGNGDICLDYEFTGGTLANSAAWTSFRSYYVDANTFATSATVSSAQLGASGSNQGCNDRGVNHLYGARVNSQCTIYNQQYSSARYRDRIRLTQSGSHFAISRPTITVLGFRSIPNGVPFPGVTCNKLHIDTALPTLMFLQMTNTSGNLATLTFGAGSYGFPMPSGLSGVELVTQAAWSDSQNGRLLMSSAAALTVPEMPEIQRRSAIYTPRLTSTTGYGPYTSHGHNPIVRYTR